MPGELAAYIIKHGYAVIFLLIFLAEIGIPNPVSSELILIFVGTLTATGTLSLLPAFVTAVSADFIGTTILYFVMYFFGAMLKKYSWFPHARVEALSKRVSKNGKWGIYVGRLIPYVRGYVSVAAGILQIPPLEFMSVVIFSALTASGGYVLIGHFIGPHLANIELELGLSQTGFIILVLIIIAIVAFAGHHISKKHLGKIN